MVSHQKVSIAPRELTLACVWTEMKEKMKLVDVMELDQIQLDQQLQNMRSKMFTVRSHKK